MSECSNLPPTRPLPSWPVSYMYLLLDMRTVARLENRILFLLAVCKAPINLKINPNYQHGPFQNKPLSPVLKEGCWPFSFGRRPRCQGPTVSSDLYQTIHTDTITQTAQSYRAGKWTSLLLFNPSTCAPADAAGVCVV